MDTLIPRGGTASCPSGDGTTYTSSDGQQYELYCETSFSGDDLPSSSAQTFTDCIAACDNFVPSQSNGGGAECVSVTFGAVDPNGNRCWLHYSITDVLNDWQTYYSARNVQYAVGGDAVYSPFAPAAASPTAIPVSSPAPSPPPSSQQSPPESSPKVEASNAPESAAPPPSSSAPAASSSSPPSVTPSISHAKATQENTPTSTSSTSTSRLTQTQSSTSSSTGSITSTSSTLSLHTEGPTQTATVTSEDTQLFNTVTATATAVPSPSSGPGAGTPLLSTTAKVGIGVAFAVLFLLFLALAGILLRQRHHRRRDLAVRRSNEAHGLEFSPAGPRGGASHTSNELGPQYWPSEKEAGVPWRIVHVHELHGDAPGVSELESVGAYTSNTLRVPETEGHRRNRSWVKSWGSWGWPRS